MHCHRRAASCNAQLRLDVTFHSHTSRRRPRKRPSRFANSFMFATATWGPAGHPGYGGPRPCAAEVWGRAGHPVRHARCGRGAVVAMGSLDRSVHAAPTGWRDHEARLRRLLCTLSMSICYRHARASCQAQPQASRPRLAPYQNSPMVREPAWVTFLPRLFLGLACFVALFIPPAC